MFHRPPGEKQVGNFLVGRGAFGHCLQGDSIFRQSVGLLYQQSTLDTPVNQRHIHPGDREFGFQNTEVFALHQDFQSGFFVVWGDSNLVEGAAHGLGHLCR